MKVSQIRRLLEHGFSIEITRNGRTERYDQLPDGTVALTYKGEGICDRCGKPFSTLANPYYGCRCDQETIKIIPWSSMFRAVLDVAKTAQGKIISSSMQIQLVA